jgi:hypothetical protein
MTLAEWLITMLIIMIWLSNFSIYCAVKALHQDLKKHWQQQNPPKSKYMGLGGQG